MRAHGELAHAATAQMLASTGEPNVPSTITPETSEPAIISAGKPPNEEIVKRQPLTSETASAVSGSIDVGDKRRAKRLSEGWDPD